MKLNIACLQINPTLGQIEANCNKVRSILAKVATSLDIVVLPELAVTGYNFQSRRAIEPYLESKETGPSVAFAREISRSRRCFTVIGYPEIQNNTIYNSAVLVGPHGKVLHHYRKTFLYEADEQWGCSENPKRDFEAFDLILDKNYYLDPPAADSKAKYPSIRTNIGICMDLNPYKFEAPFNAFEFAISCYEQKARLILCPMAWLSPTSPSIHDGWSANEKLQKGKAIQDRYFSTEKEYQINEARETAEKNAVESSGPDEPRLFVPSLPDWNTVNYWILRFFPFLVHPNSLPQFPELVTVVTCNRTGVEHDVVYGGSSSIIQFDGSKPSSTAADSTSASVEVHGSLGQGSEGALVRQVEVSTV